MSVHQQALSEPVSQTPAHSRLPPIAFSERIAQAEPAIRKQVRRYPLSAEDQEDVTQQTLLQVTRRIESFRGESSFSTWLFRVTANEVLMALRSQRRRRAKVSESASNEIERDDSTPLWNCPVDIEADILSGERKQWVQNALRELPADYQAVVLAHYGEDQGLQDIATGLELSESAVRSRLHRARIRLREILTQNAELCAA
jgi:RNA polymerase sigma-70 factor, ECF subfamily